MFVAIGIQAQDVDYHELSLQEQADFSRWLGWVWGDGEPLDTDNLTGIRYAGPTSSNFDNRYNDVTDRLKDAGLGIVLSNGNTNRRRIQEPWDYWTNAIPGGNPGDSQLLKDAVLNPNFLAGIIDTEGGNCGSTGNNYYIDDHFYAPSHPDDSRQWGLLHFGPYRMIELFHLIGGTYGFGKTTMQIGTQGTRYLYEDVSEREAAIQRVLDEFDNTEAINQAATTFGEARTTRVRIYIDITDWDTFRSYGYWTFPRRYPDCDDQLTSLSGSFPLTNLPLANANECQQLENENFETPSSDWLLSLFGDAAATLNTSNGYAEVDIEALGTAQWHVKLEHGNLELEKGKRYQITFDAFAEDDRFITVLVNGAAGYYFKSQEITTAPTLYAHEFIMEEDTDMNGNLSFNVGIHKAHKVYFDNIQLVELDCDCPENRFFFDEINNTTEHYRSSNTIFGFNVIEGDSIIFDATNCVQLDIGFEVSDGAIFQVFNDGCE